MSRYLEIDDRFWSIRDLALQNTHFGVCAGFYRNMRAVTKFGHNGTVGAAYEALWNEGGLGVYPATPTVQKISSSSVADVLTSGTGAWTVDVYGLGPAFHEQSERVGLNGRTAVNTLKTYSRVYRMVVRSAGSGLINAGIIYAGTGALTDGKPAVVHALVEVGEGQTLMGMVTVPEGVRCYLMRYEFGSSIAKAVTSGLYVRPPGEVFQVTDYRQFIDGVSEGLSPVIFDARTDIEMRAKTGAGGGDISGQMTLWWEYLRE